MEERQRLKYCYIIGLVLLILLTIARYKLLQDHHGALIMSLVAFLAILGLAFDHDYDTQCCKNCGIMALIGCALDLSIAFEALGRQHLPKVSWGHRLPSTWVFVLMHLAFSAAQLAWALLCLYVCMRTEDSFWGSNEGVILASQEEARIYGAAIQWAERRNPSTGTRSPQGSAKEVAENFCGSAHKVI